MLEISYILWDNVSDIVFAIYDIVRYSFLTISKLMGVYSETLEMIVYIVQIPPF